MIAGCCALSGVFILTLPIPIVVDNFGDYYAEQKRLEQAELKKEAQELEAAKASSQQDDEEADEEVLTTVGADELDADG